MPDVGADFIVLGTSRSTVVSVPIPLPAESLSSWGKGKKFLRIHTLRLENIGLNPIVYKVLAIDIPALLRPYMARTMITNRPSRLKKLGPALKQTLSAHRAFRKALLMSSARTSFLYRSAMRKRMRTNSRETTES